MDWQPRQFPRFKAALPVELRPIGLSVPLRGQTGDISLGGLYVEMTFTQQISTELDISLWIGDHKIRARGTVVSNHPAFGNGIKFTYIDETDRDGLKRFITSLQGNNPPARSGLRLDASRRRSLI